jgi:transposase
MSRAISKRLACIEPGTLFVGVDLSLDDSVAVVLDGRAKQLDRFRFPNDADGYCYFHRRLTAVQERQEAPAVLVGMEPTNYFWKLLASDFERHQVPYRMVNPYTVKKHREGSQLSRSKNDYRDAFTIGDLLRTGKFTETQLLHGDYAELRQYVVLRDRIVGDIRRQKSLIHNIAGQLFPELAHEFTNFTCVTALAVLRHHAIPAKIRALSLDDFIQAARVDFTGLRLPVSKLCRAYALAKRSVGVQHGTEALQHGLCLHIEMLETLQRQLERLEEALLDTFLGLPQAPYLLSMPGLGPITAAIILAEIGDPSRYSNANQLIKLAGTQPVPNLSGRKARSRTPMSHKGRRRLRTALYFAVMRLVQTDDNLAQIYRRFQEREKNPLTKMQALGALMNKLLRILWALMKHQSFYDPTYEMSS